MREGLLGAEGDLVGLGAFPLEEIARRLSLLVMWEVGLHSVCGKLINPRVSRRWSELVSLQLTLGPFICGVCLFFVLFFFFQ